MRGGRIGLITEAEHLVGELQPTADPARLVAPRENLTSIVPSGERVTAANLSSTPGSYYDALVAADASRAPFADGCERQENGAIAAGPGLPPAPFEITDV